MQTTQLTKEHIKVIEEELIILLIMGKVSYNSPIGKRLVVYKQIESKLGLVGYEGIYSAMNSLLRELDPKYKGIPLWL